ncbi:type-F conjugative transfer system mating-pair stabilization protein TraN [Arsenophonus sp.]|uniref:type-F conjugative transfer system mating-pair stabilization protein TraN n=1 Tax=Arsenophonus sp. TaxID=1872640 RepID=UPI00285CFBC3|nr:type-F conjugative transfer system mating-pair stabilization protein TraN [Arsenophonus sp.]MDR5614293.1 type-F conjugative transfer system mating-pair stabilization protein TraN [Arsenophonus sp.]
MNKILTVPLLMFAISAFANDMDNAAKEGYDLAEQTQKQAESTLKDFQPQKELPNFTPNPNEADFYQDASKIGNAANQSLNDSELGKLARETYINNPKDKIDWQSDMVKNSQTIQENAEGITAGSAEQCSKKGISQSTFKEHICERGKTIVSTCTNTASVEWTSETQTRTVTRVYQLQNLPFHKEGSRIVVVITPDIEGTIEKVTYTHPGCHRCYGGVEVSGLSGDFFYWIGSRQTLSGELNITDRTFTQSRPIRFSHNDRDSSKRYHFNIPAKLTLYFTLKVNETIWHPKVVWTANCPVDKANAVKAKAWCSQKGETRYVVKDGKRYPVTLPCWQESEEWVVSERDDNTCGRWEKDPNCSEGTRQCLQKIGNLCVKESVKFQCQQTTQGEGFLCGGKFYCSDGKCAAIASGKNNDFGEAVSQLAALAKAGKDISGEGKNISAFTGKPLACRKTAIGFSNCCKSSGWGHDIGLASCDSEEKAIGKAKEKGLVVDVGEFCAEKVLGVCLRKKHSYCVFDSKLAQIVQAQGRGSQLGVGFGNAKHPDCRGLTIDELQQVKFDLLDFTEFYDELNSKTTLPDSKKLTEKISQQIKNELQGRQP